MRDPTRLRELRASLLASAVAALEAGRFQEAERQASAWTAHDAADVEATMLHGLALAAQGDVAQAAPLLQRVATVRPTFAHPCRDLARLRPDAPDLVAAAFRACRTLAPRDPRLAYAYADFLLDTGKPAAAAAVLRRVRQSDAWFAPAHNLYGMALIDLGDMPGAIEAFREAIALNRQDAAAWANLGMALKIEGRFDECFDAYDRATAAAPQDAQIRLNRAVALLRAGRMAEAWADYESRLVLGRPRLPMETLLPSLATLPDLTGRTVLAWHEEGFGDTLQFARYLPLLAARGARVLAFVPAELQRLLRTLAGVAEVLGPPAPVPPFDWHVPFFSLPRAFGTTLESIPDDVPYLFAEPARAAAWAPLLPEHGLRVGLVWAGQARPWLPGFSAIDRRRSIDLAELAPLAQIGGVSLVALQKGPAAREAEPLPPGMTLVDPMPGVADFADTAAIIAGLDVVVSVDTAVAHLAGALGKRVLLLDRYDNCWRWLAGRDDSPWYPSLRIFRQPRAGDWSEPVARVAAELARLAGAAGAR
jgi:tetratricopeptide (TPR) repeat protein